MERVVRDNPILFLQYPDIIANHPDLESKMDIGQLLLRNVQTTKSAWHYIANFDEYAHLPEAREIVQTAIYKNPVSFFERQSLGFLSDQLEEEGYITLPIDRLYEIPIPRPDREEFAPG